MKQILTSIPSLGYRNNRYVLYYNPDKETSLELEIRYSYTGDNTPRTYNAKEWNAYRFFVSTNAENYRLVTSAEWYELYEGIMDHEGELEAKKWADSDAVQAPFYGENQGIYLQYFNALIARWEAMLELGLFIPMVNL